MFPSPAEVESARRVLKAIKDGIYPSQADALVLGLWAGPRTRMRSLEQTAKEIIGESSRSPEPPTYI